MASTQDFQKFVRSAQMGVSEFLVDAIKSLDFEALAELKKISQACQKNYRVEIETPGQSDDLTNRATLR